MTLTYLPIDYFRTTDSDYSSIRIRDMPYGKHREELVLNPSEIDFGNMIVGRVSPVEAILLSNTGYDHVTIQEILTVGDFIYNGDQISQIKVGEVISLNVSFYPQSMGPLTGGLYVTASTAVGVKFASLSGSGVETQDGLMQYPLLESGNITGQPITISNGVYTFIVSGTPDGALAQLQWRPDSSGSWIDIPNTKLTVVNTIYGIPLNYGQARVFIANSKPGTSLTAKLIW